MNTGIQDALNLGWKLAFACAATDRTGLLDSYERERRQVARRVLALTHLAFWAEAGSRRLPAIMRGVMAPVSAAVLPTVMGQRRLVAEVVRCVSQLRMSYPRSPISVTGAPRRGSGPRPGHWPPDATVIVDGRRVRLHALLARPGVHVLLDRGAPSVDQSALGPYVHVHRLDSTSGTGVTARRPDGYVGLCGDRLEVEQLSGWLRRIGALPNAVDIQMV
jgi:hypothetical protein